MDSPEKGPVTIGGTWTGLGTDYVVSNLVQVIPAITEADMEKDNFFTQTWFEPKKIFYPKKCVNYYTSNMQQNSLKGPKDPNSANKMHKNNIQFLNVLKNSTKK